MASRSRGFFHFAHSILIHSPGSLAFRSIRLSTASAVHHTSENTVQMVLSKEENLIHEICKSMEESLDTLIQFPKQSPLSLIFLKQGEKDDVRLDGKGAIVYLEEESWKCVVDFLKEREEFDIESVAPEGLVLRTLYKEKVREGAKRITLLVKEFGKEKADVSIVVQASDYVSFRESVRKELGLE